MSVSTDALQSRATTPRRASLQSGSRSWLEGRMMPHGPPGRWLGAGHLQRPHSFLSLFYVSCLLSTIDSTDSRSRVGLGCLMLDMLQMLGWGL
jgi:hypothetical protein